MNLNIAAMDGISSHAGDINTEVFMSPLYPAEIELHQLGYNIVVNLFGLDLRPESSLVCEVPRHALNVDRELAWALKEQFVNTGRPGLSVGRMDSLQSQQETTLSLILDIGMAHETWFHHRSLLA
jgi:hypothetical protein